MRWTASFMSSSPYCMRPTLRSTMVTEGDRRVWMGSTDRVFSVACFFGGREILSLLGSSIKAPP